MKKNLYYRTVFRRKNAIKEFLLTFFLGVASWPRLLLEVFIRKNFGERYFSFSTAIIMTVILAIFPYAIAQAQSYSSFGGGGISFWSFVGHNLTWYIFLALFIIVCLRRRHEVKRLPSVFDFERFSLSAGIVNPAFFTIKLGGKDPDIRTVETLIEPAFFLIIGVVLALMAQSVGVLIVVCSIIYSLSYFGAYYIGDNFIMDKIDEMICNENLVASFVDGRKPEETKGFNAYGRKPDNKEFRRRVVDSFFEDDEGNEAAEAM